MCFGSVVTAMVTPFAKDGSVNYKKAQELAVHLMENGSSAVVVSGTTGESPTLTSEEKIKLLIAVKEAVGDKGKVIIGSTGNATQPSIELTKEAERAGADGILAVVPYYNKPSQDGLYAHFKAIAECTTLPVLLYNIPGRSSINMTPETIAKLSKIKNIVGVKEASGSMAQVSDIRCLTDDDFAIYSGDDSLTLPILALGGCGIVSVAGHVFGNELKEMIDKFQAGDHKGATKIHCEILEACKMMFITSNPVPVKTCLNLLGWELGDCRLPLIGANEQQIAQLDAMLKKYHKK